MNRTVEYRAEQWRTERSRRMEKEAKRRRKMTEEKKREDRRERCAQHKYAHYSALQEL